MAEPGGRSAPLCHQSSPPVIAPHSLLPPCQFSAPHLASVARAESVVVGLEWWPVQLSSTCPLSCRKPGHTLLAPLSTQPPASLPLPPLPLARNIKVSGQLPHASKPTSISTGSSQPAIGYLATVSSSPPALSSQPPLFLSLHILRSHLLLGASRPITNTYSATCQSHIFSNICQILINIYSASFPHKKS